MLSNIYGFKLHYAILLNLPKKDLALIYASIAQTYQDLEDFMNSLKYYQLELDNCGEDTKDSVSIQALYKMH